MFPVLGPIISGIFSLGKSYLDNKAEEKQALHQRKIEGIKNDANWENIQAENSGNSWKDEYLTIIITSPFVAMFLAVVFNAPELVLRMKEAFVILDTHVPDEYWYLLGVCFAASFAIKGVPTVISKLRGKE